VPGCVDAGQESLWQLICFARSDLLEYLLMAEHFAARSDISIALLYETAVADSDDRVANLLPDGCENRWPIPTPMMKSRSG